MQAFETQHDELETPETSKKQKLFSDETYNLLLNAQQTIFDQTGFRVTLRKLLDKLINQASIDILTTTFIEKLKF